MRANALRQALDLIRAGKADQAEIILLNLLKSAPDEPDALQLLGAVARSRKDNIRAVEWFRKSLRARPDQPHVLNNLGNALLDLDQCRDAVEAYGKAVKLKPDYADALINLGLAHLCALQPEEAVEVLERAVLVAGRDARALSAYGRALRAAGRTDEAIEAFRTSLLHRPRHLPTLHNYAVALRLAGKANEAAALLEDCAKAEPAAAEIHYNLGHCYYDLGRLDEAAARYHKAVTLQPNDRDAHDSLSRLYWQKGDRERYLSSYAWALQRDPDDAGLLSDLANWLNLGGRSMDATRLLESAIARGVDTAELRERLGEALAAQGDLENALSHFRAASDADPERISARLEAVRTLIVLGRYTHALTALGPVIAMRPYNQQAIAFQALAWRFLGDARANALNDYNGLIMEQILEPPPQWGGVEAFNRRLEAALAALHVTREHPLEQTLRGGTQTMGDLFDRDIPEIQAVRRMIEEAVRRYIARLPDDAEHVFHRRKSDRFHFSGSWSVRLRSQGFHLNHLHSEGWISSCYYVGLPASVQFGSDHQGWLKFGETSLALEGREAIARVIQPKVGKLVLFPSYFYHGTVPFEEDAFRTTIAFDVAPLAAAPNSAVREPY